MSIDLAQELRDALRAVGDELGDIVRRAVREELTAQATLGDPAALVDVKEAAKLLGTTEGALRRRLERGRSPLRVTRVGRSLRLKRADILPLANGGKR